MQSQVGRTSSPRVLLVEDDIAHARLIRASLRRVGIDPEHAGTQAAAQRFLRESEYDVVLLDVDLPDGDGFEVQQWLNDNAITASVVFVTADDLAEHATEAVRSGAVNYVVKRPNYLERLVDATAEALESRAEQTGVLGTDPSNAIAQQIIGWSPSTVEARKLIGEYAQQLRPLLVVGEAGTGRSAVSRMVHAASKRTGPYVVVSCRELSERLAGGKAGNTRFLERLAEPIAQGTLVLEDVTDASPALQQELLATVDNLSNRNVRLIVEAEFDLALHVAEERFAEALAMRLSGTRINLVPLRDRTQDIRSIASRELSRLGVETGRGRLDVDDEAWTVLEAHGWNGNLHELLSCVRTIVGSCSGKSAFDRYDVEAALDDIKRGFTPRSQHEQRERARLKAALDRHEWNVTATARALDVSRGWLRRRIDWFEL